MTGKRREDLEENKRKVMKKLAPEEESSSSLDRNENEPDVAEESLDELPNEQSADKCSETNDDIAPVVEECEQDEVQQDVPFEILQKIFAYLPLADRKSVRMVCKTWYRVGISFPFLNREMLVCRRDHSVSEFYLMLVKTKREFVHLKFCNVKFTSNNSFVFRGMKTNVRSLHFEACIEVDYIAAIIADCDTFENLILDFYSPYDPDDLEYFAHYLAWAKVSKSTVKNVTINVKNHRWLSQICVQQLFLIFPQVRTMKINPKLPYLPEVLPKEIFSNRSFLRLRNYSTSVMRTIDDYKPASEGRYCDHETEERNQVTRANSGSSKETRERDCYWSVEREELNQDVIDELSQLDCVGELCLGLRKAKTEISSSFILLLNRVAYLRHITLHTAKLHVTSGVLNALLSSQLISIHFNFVDITISNDLTVDESFIPNMSLIRLMITGTTTKADIALPFVKYFRKLTLLEIEYASNIVMGNICKHQINLETLILFNPQCTDDGFVGWRDPENRYDRQTYSVDRLTKLKSLSIRYEDVCRLTEKTFERFTFFELENLIIYILKFQDDYTLDNHTNDFLQDRITMGIKKCRNLRLLTIRYDYLKSFRAWYNLCLDLPWLRRLIIYGDPEHEVFTDKEYRLFFEACAALIHLYRGPDSASLGWHREVYRYHPHLEAVYRENTKAYRYQQMDTNFNLFSYLMNKSDPFF